MWLRSNYIIVVLLATLYHSRMLALRLQLAKHSLSSSQYSNLYSCRYEGFIDRFRRSTKFTRLYAKKSKSKPIAANSDEFLNPKRVSGKLNVSVRQQIAWANAVKRLTSNTKQREGKTRFRQGRGPKASNETWETLETFDGELDYANLKPPAVFVDGYNIIGYMQGNSRRGDSGGLLSEGSLGGDLASARDGLISDLAVLRAATGWWIEVVFDAYKSKTSEVSSVTDNLRVTYTGVTETADTYIERRFGELTKEGFKNMVVATDDQTLRVVAGSTNAHSGSGFLSAQQLVEEIEIAYQGWEIIESDLQAEANRNKPTIGDGTSREVQDAIAALKVQKLKEKKAWLEEQIAIKKAEAAAEQEEESRLKQNGKKGKFVNVNSANIAELMNSMKAANKENELASSKQQQVDEHASLPPPSAAAAAAAGSTTDSDSRTTDEQPFLESDKSAIIDTTKETQTPTQMFEKNKKKKKKKKKTEKQGEFVELGDVDMMDFGLKTPTIGDAMSDDLRAMIERMGDGT